MNKVITIIAIILFNTTLNAQIDTITKQQNEIVEIYDVVAVYKESTDGRGQTRKYVSELKGEILNYDESTGVLTFKGVDGKMYSFKSGDYKYFEYDKEFIKKDKSKNKVIRPRKDKGFGYNAGIGLNYVNMSQSTTGDNYFLEDYYVNGGIPISLYGAFGKYFGRKHFLAICADFVLNSEPGGYAVGGRYVFQYDEHKRNTAFYLPVEVKYQHLNLVTGFRVKDSIWYDEYSYSYPGNIYPMAGFNNIGLTIGHGFGFIKKEGRAFNLELSYTRSFILSVDYKDPLFEPNEPKTSFSIGTFKMGLFFSF